MAFIIPWLGYLLAFVAGSAVAWGITTVTVRRTSREEAAAALSGSGEKVEES
ncbi:MAG TPA: hypothetical protein VFR17_10125 [Mycobacterium sp.]|nr:hypothetical protein [Mycobacterium sp.]